MSNLHYTRFNTFHGCRKFAGPSPLQSATGTPFNVAAVVGHCQLVLDLIDAGIEPGFPLKIRHWSQTRLPLAHPAGLEQILFYDIVHFMTS